MTADRDELALLSSGAVHLFHADAVLADWTSSLEEQGYSISRIDCSEDETMRQHFSNMLRWEEQFGYAQWNGNLDALNDGMRGVPFPALGKHAVVLHEFHRLVRRSKRTANSMLDIFEYQARDHLLLGNRLLVLVHTADPKFNPGPLGGRDGQWNPDEWMTKNRGI